MVGGFSAVPGNLSNLRAAHITKAMRPSSISTGSLPWPWRFAMAIRLHCLRVKAAPRLEEFPKVRPIIQVVTELGSNLGSWHLLQTGLDEIATPYLETLKERCYVAPRFPKDDSSQARYRDSCW